MSQIMNDEQVLEYAAIETFNRHMASKQDDINLNISYAIASAATHGNYNGFTRNNDARAMVCCLDGEQITKALLKNMVRLSNYEHSNPGSITNDAKTWVMYCMESIKSNNISTLKNQLLTGMSLFVSDGKNVDFQNPNRIIAENQSEHLAFSLLNSYVDYNVRLGFVRSEDNPQNMIDKMWMDKLNDYYGESASGRGIR